MEAAGVYRKAKRSYHVCSFFISFTGTERVSERNEARGVAHLQIEPDEVKALPQKRFVGKCSPDEPIFSEVQTSDPATFVPLLQAEFFLEHI